MQCSSTSSPTHQRRYCTNNWSNPRIGNAQSFHWCINWRIKSQIENAKCGCQRVHSNVQHCSTNCTRNCSEADGMQRTATLHMKRLFFTCQNNFNSMLDYDCRQHGVRYKRLRALLHWNGRQLLKEYSSTPAVIIMVHNDATSNNEKSVFRFRNSVIIITSFSENYFFMQANGSLSVKQSWTLNGITIDFHLKRFQNEWLQQGLKSLSTE